MSRPLYRSPVTHTRTLRELQQLRREARRSLFLFRALQLVTVLGCVAVLALLMARTLPVQTAQALHAAHAWLARHFPALEETLSLP